MVKYCWDCLDKIKREEVIIWNNRILCKSCYKKEITILEENAFSWKDNTINLELD